MITLLLKTVTEDTATIGNYIKPRDPHEQTTTNKAPITVGLIKYKQQLKLTTITTDLTSVAVCISKCLRKGFSIIKR